MSLEAINNMSEDELRDALLSYGFQPGPINGFTKVVYVKKLASLMEGATSVGPPSAPPPAMEQQHVYYDDRLLDHQPPAAPVERSEWTETTHHYEDRYTGSGSAPYTTTSGGRFGYDTTSSYQTASGLSRRSIHNDATDGRRVENSTNQQRTAGVASRSWLTYLVFLVIGLVVLYVVFGGRASTGPVPQIRYSK